MTEFDEKLYRYRIAMSVAKKMYSEGIISGDDYAEIDTIMTKKHGLSLDSIFRLSNPHNP